MLGGLFISYQEVSRTVAEGILECIESEPTKAGKINFLSELLTSTLDPTSMQLLFLSIVLMNIAEPEKGDDPPAPGEPQP